MYFCIGNIFQRFYDLLPSSPMLISTMSLEIEKNSITVNRSCYYQHYSSITLLLSWALTHREHEMDVTTLESQKCLIFSQHQLRYIPSRFFFHLTTKVYRNWEKNSIVPCPWSYLLNYTIGIWALWRRFKAGRVLSDKHNEHCSEDLYKKFFSIFEIFDEVLTRP